MSGDNCATTSTIVLVIQVAAAATLEPYHQALQTLLAILLLHFKQLRNGDAAWQKWQNGVKFRIKLNTSWLGLSWLFTSWEYLAREKGLAEHCFAVNALIAVTRLSYGAALESVVFC